MEAWSKLKKLFYFLKKWWKLLLGFSASIFVLAAFKKKDGNWKEYSDNATENLKMEIEAEKLEKEKLDKARNNLDIDFESGLADLKEDLVKKKKKLDEDEEAAKEKIKKDGVSKSIADLLGAEHVKIESEN